MSEGEDVPLRPSPLVMAASDQGAPSDWVVRGQGTFPSRGLSTFNLHYKRFTETAAEGSATFIGRGGRNWHDVLWEWKGQQETGGKMNDVQDLLRATSWAPKTQMGSWDFKNVRIKSLSLVASSVARGRESKRVFSHR